MKFLKSIEAILFLSLVGCTMYITQPTQPRTTTFETNRFLTTDERKWFVSMKERIRWCKIRRDCKVLAEAIVYEARSESELGKAAVAHVILSRVNNEKWGDSIPEVVYQNKQFSYTNRGQEQKNVPRQKDWDSAYSIAYEVLNGMLMSPVGDATHYHTSYVRPKWAKKLKYVATIENHIFYR